ncbi:Uncharacterised protein [Kluyvera cryocrescens]|uniref:Uncharacterized protein n=1 Tax=Kluyvera cryocrescens TaxID=580 RepID=A0A485CXD0_KLUCR|nr:Uncharacterised protein [Kluyvera cryocrescens]
MQVTSLTVTDDVLPGTGRINDGGTTNDKNPTFSGGIALPLLEVGSTVHHYGRLYRNRQGRRLGLTGLWSNLPPLNHWGKGNMTSLLRWSIRPGNPSSGTNFSLTVDATPPAMVKDITLSDDVDPVKGTIVANGYTNDATPTLTGAANSAEAGSTVTIYDGSRVFGLGRRECGWFRGVSPRHNSAQRQP